MKPNAHPDYRPDIDGLRALAILSVVAFHAFPSFLPGGFVGVDVFFVISGFLISTILFKSHEAGNFSYLDFYIRRARRIFPALVLVLAFSLAAGWWILVKEEFVNIGKQIFAGTLFISNFHFLRDAGYWDTDSELKPLLHLWSLGVEEQYYLLWPVMIALFWKRSHNFLWIVLPVFISSFVLNILFVSSRPEEVFYSPFTRFWELMAGSLLAYMTLHQAPQSFWKLIHGQRPGGGKLAANGVAWGGMGLLLIGFVAIAPNSAFPGWWALLPVLGAFMIILAGEGSWINRSLLAHPVFVYVGLISYPLYLWHWPLLSFAKYIHPDLDVLTRLALVATAFLLAILTYHLVEIPVRLRVAPKNAAVYATAGIAMMCGMGVMMQDRKLSPYHNPPLWPLKETLGYSSAVPTFTYGGRTYYRLGSGQKNVIVMAGDSNMVMYYHRVDQLYRQGGHSRPVVFLTLPGCLPVPQDWLKPSSHCHGFGEDIFRYARDPQVTTVVFAASWFFSLERQPRTEFTVGRHTWALNQGSENHQNTMKALVNMLKTLRQMGKQVYLVSSIPLGKQLEPLYNLKRSTLGLGEFSLIPAGGTPRQEQEARFSQVIQNIRESAAEAGVPLIEPMNYVCDETFCPSYTPQGIPMYYDSGHLNPEYVRNHVFYLDEIFKP
ncbi:MAG: acyltransferase [Deltaproteobacteria bacterium]|nr:acyltransferase [Deltaproteobacteria bacterium]